MRDDLVRCDLAVEAHARDWIGVTGFDRGEATGEVVRRLISNWRSSGREPRPDAAIREASATLVLALRRVDAEWLCQAAASTDSSVGDVLAAMVRREAEEGPPLP